ncbi:MAG: hypothetical protein KUL88_15440 [Rhizobium sp.]|nr:hypothetical protein [Rhizobium sp.]
MDEKKTGRSGADRAARVVLAPCAVSVVLLAAVAGHAAETKPPKLVVKPETFHDLPGVKPQGDLQFGSPYSCDTVIREVRSRNEFGRHDDGMPVRVYRCTKDGVVYESRQPPNPSGGWYPGVNPRIIDR